MAAPAAEQCRHAVEDFRLVVDAQHHACRRVGSLRCAAARCSCVSIGSAGASGTVDREMRAAAGLRSRGRPSDRARARCARRSRARAQARAPPSRPDRADGIRGRSRASSIAGCRDRYRRRRCAGLPPPSRQPIRTRPCGVYLMAFEIRFCSSRRSSRRSDRTARVLGTKVSCESLLARERREFDLELAHQLVEAEGRNLRPHRAGIEPRNIEQRAENFLHGLERGVDVRDELRVLAAALTLDQAGHVEARRIERLQDVVARGGEEARLGDVGLLGLALGAPQRVVEAGQFLGALLDAPLEVFVRALERVGGFDARRHVGCRGDEAAVRHVVGADFDHQPALGEALADRLAPRDSA